MRGDAVADYLLGIDYGTGGAKACIIDTAGTVLGFTFEEYPFIHEHSGWSEHDAGRYWDVACRLIRGAIEEARVPASAIRAVAVSSALPSLVMVDGKGIPIERAYNLMDRRAVAQVESLKGAIGEDRIFALSGNRLEDHPSLVNLLWEKENRPDSFARIAWALAIDGYITLRLTGKPSAHYSGAAFYGVAYDLRRRRFDGDLLGEIGIDPSILPPLHRCEDIVGEVTAEAAKATGLEAGTGVAAGQVDCNAGWVGAGAVSPGDIQSNLGTVGNFGVVHRSEEFIFSDVGRSMINFAYTTDSESTYVTVPTTTTGGSRCATSATRSPRPRWRARAHPGDIRLRPAQPAGSPGSARQRRSAGTSVSDGRTDADLGRLCPRGDLWALAESHQGASRASHDGSGGLCYVRLLSSDPGVGAHDQQPHGDERGWGGE
jgi:xylulokinase